MAKAFCKKGWMLALLMLVLIVGVVCPTSGYINQMLPTGTAYALDDSLASTPTLGWNTWNKFGCNVSADLIKETADAMVSSGMKDAGYQYIVIDDCWQAGKRGVDGSRDADGFIQPDPTRFPDMKELADYVHSKGLKLGIYSSAGSGTCQNKDAGFGYEDKDAQQYARWGIDFLKYDWCNHPSLNKSADIDRITVTGTGGAAYADLEAEAGTLDGASTTNCADCSGSTKVTNIGNNEGTLTFNDVQVPADGTYQLTIYYTNGFVAPADVASRKAWVKVNGEGGEGTYVGFTGTGADTTVGSISVNVSLKAGDNTLLFYNPMTEKDNGVELYTRMQTALETYAPNIVFNLCEWGSNKPWEWNPKVGHSWRTTFDIQDNWPSIADIIDSQASISKYSGPARWNDPDMLEIGNGGMSETEYMTHFSMWSMLAAPLVAGNDLTDMSESTRNILTNTDVIAIDQDPLGKGAERIIDNGDQEVWVKPLANGDVAVALYNAGDTGAKITVSAQVAGLADASSYTLRDLWQHTDTISSGAISAYVARHGVAMYRVSAGSDSGDASAALLDVASKQALLPGHTYTLTSTFTNWGISSISQGSIQFETPDGWNVEEVSGSALGQVAAGDSVTSQWRITPPADAATGIHELTATAQYEMDNGAEGTVVSQASLIVPSVLSELKDSYLSDLQTIDASNTTVADQGLTMSVPGKVTYYLGGSFSSFTVDAGFNASSGGFGGGSGSVILEVWADGKQLYRSDVLDSSSSVENLSFDVSGKQLLTLKTFTGGKSVMHFGDRSKWSNALLSGVIESVNLDSEQYELKAGQSAQLNADAVYTGGPSISVTGDAEYTSSNPSVVTISDEGVVTGVGEGTATVTVTYGGRSATAQITVTSLTDAAVLNGPSKVSPGEEFDVTYGLAGLSQEVYAQDVTIAYDAEQLEFVSAQSADERLVIAGQSASAGKVRILGANVGSDHSGNGNWLTLKFRAKSAQSAESAISVTDVVVADQLGTEAVMSGATQLVHIEAADKSALISLIASAQSKHDGAVEGSKPGQYAAGSKAALQAAIDSAQAVADNSAAAQADVEQAIADLTSALQTFANSVHASEPSDTNDDGVSSIGDLGIVASAYGKTSADSDWAQYKKADVNNDGKVDVEDLAIVASKILE